MTKRVLITGSGGLVGSEACRFFLEKEYDVTGVDNNMRRYFFGEKGDTSANVQWLKKNFGNFSNFDLDIRNKEKMYALFQSVNPDLIIHTAAQPSHDWATKEPLTDFGINAVGTLNLLEATKIFAPEAVFIFTSTNKVYGDNPNKVPLKELDTRWNYDFNSDFLRQDLRLGVSEEGINECMSLDDCVHSVFGVSKVAADLMVQEYGKNFGLKTGSFRGGCLTGSQHSAVELHGFLNYIVKCAKSKTPYTIFGYKGKQVRDQIHSSDVVNAFWHFFQNPRPGEVYNLGGGKQNSVSILEVIEMLEKNFGLKTRYSYSEINRVGDHICYYSDMSKFKTYYPEWKILKNLEEILVEIVEDKK